MKIVTYILIGLLVVSLGGGAYFYLYEYKRMAVEYEKFKAGQPEFEKARKELKRYADQEKREAGWTGAAAESLKKGFANEIAAGKAEVVVSGSRIVVNIADAVLFTPQSITFARDGRPALDNLTALLKEFKDKEIIVGNMTQAAQTQGKGRKRVPAKDARALAAGRSVELVKYLEKNGVPAEALIAASYPAKMPDRGFKIRDQKTVIVIAAPAASGLEVPAQNQEAKAAPVTRSAPAATVGPAVAQPKSIPISTVPPKKVP